MEKRGSAPQAKERRPAFTAAECCTGKAVDRPPRKVLILKYPDGYLYL